MEEGQTLKDGNNYRTYKEGWNFVHIEGEPFARGEAYGRLMADEILGAVTEASRLLMLQTGLEWDFLISSELSILHRWKERLAEPPYREFLEEMAGMVQGVRQTMPDSPLTVDDLILWNGYEELTGYWLPSVADKLYDSLSMQPMGGRTYKRFHAGANDHCSAFIATGSYTADGRIVMAHNSFTPYENSNYMNVVTDIRPARGNSFIMQSSPGYIHSLSDFYETSTGPQSGLMITETTIGGFKAYDCEGVPEFARIRYAVQYAGSLDEFAEMFWKNNNGGYANIWLAGDIGTNEIMRFEAGLKFYRTDKTKDGFYAGFNAPTDPRIRNLECENSGFADIRRHQGARQVRIPQLMETYKGRIDNKIARKILADHYDVYLNKENPCSRSICAHYELDDRAYMSQAGRPVPFQPRGAVDAVTADSANALELSLWVRWGSSCGMPFYADAFLEKNPQFEYLREFLKDRPSRPWIKVKKY